MGCSSSSAQTVEQEKRPGTKPEESGGDALGESPRCSPRLCFGDERELWFAQVCAQICALCLVLLRGVSVVPVHCVLSHAAYCSKVPLGGNY